MVIKTPLSAESCAAQQEAVRWQSWDCAEWGTIFLKLEGADKTCQSKESFCLCVHLYLCCFACVCAPLQNPGEMLIWQPQWQNTLISCWMCPELAATGQVVPGRAVLQLSLCPTEARLSQALLSFQALISFASNVPKVSENLAADFGKLKPVHKIWESCYWISHWHGQLMPVLVVVSLMWAFAD